MEKKKVNVFGIILSVLILLCGVLLFAMPVKMSVFNAWFILGALIVKGVYMLITYFSAPKESKNGWILADGIISTLLGVLVLIDLLMTPVATTLGIISGLGYLVGFYEIFIGVNYLCNMNNAESKGWAIFLGILNIICGLFVTTFPILSTLALEFIFGVYLIVFGISILVKSISE